MKKKVFIELLEEYEKVNIYSIRIDGESLTEFEKFIIENKEKHQKDLGLLAYRIQKIAEDGVFDRHFRYEGKWKDRVSAIPSHIDISKVRVYCICINEQTLILGNGGLKDTRTYNMNPILSEIVNIMQKVDREIKRKEKLGLINIIGKNISGELYIEIDN